jgi:hypothetical protein
MNEDRLFEGRMSVPKETTIPLGHSKAGVSASEAAARASTLLENGQRPERSLPGLADAIPHLPVTTRRPLQQQLTHAGADSRDDETDLPHLRLPSAWYAKASDSVPATEGLSPERHGHLIRGTAAASLALGVVMLGWLGMGGTTSTTPPPSSARASIVTSLVPISEFAPAALVDEDPQRLIPTAQILAVAERFIATGDILAARAMLSNRAGSGEPRALFALAETYDPSMLASWNARDAEPSTNYARFLYEAARRGGIAEAQTRLEALR